MRSVFLSIFCLLTFSLFAEKVPPWVTQRPVNPDYYIGIAYVDKSLIDYAESARNKALAELTAQIKVNVDFKIVTEISEIGNINNEDITQSIRISSGEVIKNLECYATWENKKEYWVYYRILRSEYERQKTEFRHEVAKRTLVSIQNAVENQNLGKISEAISAYLDAFYFMEPLMETGFTVSDSQGTANVYRIVESGLQGILSRLQITLSDSLTFKRGEEKQINGMITFNEHPVSGLPLIIQTDSLRLECLSQAETDHEGQFILPMKRLKTDKSSRLQLRIDYQKLYGNHETTPFFFRCVYRYDKAVKSYDIRDLPILIRFNQEELFDSWSKAQILLPFEEKLQAKGFVITHDREKYDYALTIDFNIKETKFSGAQENLQTLSNSQIRGFIVDLILSVYDVNGNQKAVFSRRGIKGFHTDMDEAKSIAVKKAVNEVFSQFNTQFSF